MSIPSEPVVQDMTRLVVSDPEFGLAASFVEFAQIKTKEGSVISDPTLNRMQAEVCEAVSWCLINNKPIRLIILKPRQKGLSTISMWIMYWMMCVYAVEAVLIGGQSSEVGLLWKYFTRYAKLDGFNWGFDRPVGAKNSTFGNGATCIQETARDEDAGRGGCFQFLCATEAARWHEGGVADANAVLAGIMSCVPTLPKTCVILESTAKGPTGFFYEYYQEAITLDEAKAGHWAENNFIKIFSPWYDHDDSRIYHDEPPKERDIVATYSSEEEQMVRDYRLTPDQIRWHRHAFVTICKKDPAQMKREFPATEDEAFHASSNQRFNSIAMKLMREQAAQQASHRDFGVLEGSDEEGRYSWQTTDEPEAAFILIEKPIEGLRYLISADTASGEYTKSKDPDKHSVLVTREGYYDDYGIWHRHKLVARTIYNCRWDGDILIDMVFRLHCFYGRCMIVPEANYGGSLIKGLKDLGALLYRRKSGDLKGDVIESKASGAFGFLTTGGNTAAGSRNQIIENLAREVRNVNKPGYGIEFFDIDGINELERFIVNPRGKAEAAEGHHDDDVMSLAINMNFISQSTKYVRESMRGAIARDLQGIGNDDRSKRQYS